MGERVRKPSVNSTNFTSEEIRYYSEKLAERYGAKAQVISLSGLSSQSYFRAMRGETISVFTKNVIVTAINKVIQSFN